MLYLRNGARFRWQLITNRKSYNGLSIAKKIDDLEWFWTSVYFSVVRVMRIVTKRLKLKWRADIARRFEVGVFQGRGLVHFKRKFQVEAVSPTNFCWCQKTRVITLSWGINMLAVCSFVSSESTCVTGGRTDRQNYDPQDCTGIAASRSKNWKELIGSVARWMLWEDVNFPTNREPVLKSQINF